MAVKIPRGKPDEIIEEIRSALLAYQNDHPKAKVDLYRQNSVSVRVRIIDPHFNGQTKPERHRTVWEYLNPLPAEVISDISTILLLTPKETKESFSNMEFDNPVASDL